MRYAILLSALLLLPMWAFGSTAEDIPSLSARLTLDDAIKHALKANYDYLNMQDRVEMAELDYSSARSIYKTKFRSSTTSDARSGAEVGSNYSLYLTKKNESGSSLTAGFYNSSFGDRTLSELRFNYRLPFFQSPLKTGKFGVDQAEIDLAKRKRLAEIGTQELVNQVISHYYRLTLAIRNNSLIKSQLAISEKMHKAVEIRARHGDLSEIDMLRSELQLSKAKQNLYTARFSQQQTADNLKLLLGMDVARPIVIDESSLSNIDENLLSLPVTELEQLALTKRTELIGKREELAMSRRKLNALLDSKLPEIDISLQYALVGEGDGLDDSFRFDDQRFGLGLRMDTDLGASEKRSKQRRSILQHQTEEREYRRLQNQTKMDVRKAYFQVKQSHNQMEMASRTLALAEQQYHQSHIRHEKGQLNKLELLDAQQQMEEAKYHAFNARVNYLLAGQELTLASGQLQY